MSCARFIRAPGRVRHQAKSCVLVRLPLPLHKPNMHSDLSRTRHYLTYPRLRRRPPPRIPLLRSAPQLPRRRARRNRALRVTRPCPSRAPLSRNQLPPALRQRPLRGPSNLQALLFLPYTLRFPQRRRPCLLLCWRRRLPRLRPCTPWRPPPRLLLRMLEFLLQRQRLVRRCPLRVLRPQAFKQGRRRLLPHRVPFLRGRVRLPLLPLASMRRRGWRLHALPLSQPPRPLGLP